jgi:hypothetical protein
MQLSREVFAANPLHMQQMAQGGSSTTDCIVSETSLTPKARCLDR